VNFEIENPQLLLIFVTESEIERTIDGHILFVILKKNSNGQEDNEIKEKEIK
jgi:hypothetical protein